MSNKRFSLRFNLEQDADREAWEHLNQAGNASKTQLVIDALVFQHRYGDLTKLIQDTIRSCLSDAPKITAQPTEQSEEMEDIISDFLDCL